LSLADYGYAWFQFFKKLMMSPQDIRKELKETEKGPEVRQRQRRFQMDIRQMRQAQEKVPGSTVLITNPTHYAVALLWQPHRMNAPEVVCKGQDRVALYMKTLAREASVPIVEERALAQTLFKTLKVGDAIHPRHYKAVAKVIRYIKRIDARHGGRREESVEG
jgi:flagellar biosynthetic protein FlhB